MGKIIPSSPAAKQSSIAEMRPDFLMPTSAPAGMELVSQFISPPRLKVVQKSAQSPIVELFNPGDVIAMPMMQIVAKIKLNDAGRPDKEGESFHITPVLFYPEWLTWNPLETKGTLNVIRERSLDPQSSIAVASRSPETWSFPCPEMPKNRDGKDLFCRHVEHLNFVVLIEPPNEFAGIPVVMTFARGEHKAGSNFCALLKMRQADIFACRFEARVNWRPGTGKGDWMGIDVMNPSDGKPWVASKEIFDTFKDVHEEMYDAYKKRLLRVDYDEEATEAPVDAPAKF